ncbi:HpcH/HpaI aldolase/citrate lyase family protein, partial [Timonella senegalensis]|uniref:HpcH/HpaI aldolase/citrate lyase family protein n=1 Tax=Timonella senegalensis TaxID=1465825 RepID=UPI002FDF7B28
MTSHRHPRDRGDGGEGIRNERAAKLPANLSRSWLLVNASKPELFEDALRSEADSVIFDLEAAVADDLKEVARYNVMRALSSGMSAWVRINAMTSPHWKDDVSALVTATGLRGVMLAETEKPDQVTLTAMQLRAGTPVIALVESAIGIENATAIASAPGTFRLAFGVNDFRKDTGVTEDPMALAYARGKLVVASRVGKLPGPIDGPPGPTDEWEDVLEACEITQRMGLTGKLCL